MSDLTLLVDYRGAFYSSTKNAATHCSMDLHRLVARFRELSVGASVLQFPDVDLLDDWSSRVVLYQSAEDPGLQYKSYIEDVVLALSLAGAHVMPGYEYLRAHHNKVFMKLLLDVRRPDRHPLTSRAFGTLEDFLRATVEYPVVAKCAEGAGSDAVHLLRSQAEAVRTLTRLTQSASLSLQTLREMARRRFRSGYVPHSLHRSKFVLQQFIAGLDHDYKVLVYGDSVFVLHRRVRDGDFRASGSGNFSWPSELPAGLLDYVWKAFQAFDVPTASFDIAEAGGTFRLIEAQFVSFGPKTLEDSRFHWERRNDAWALVEGPADLEGTFAGAVTAYARGKQWL